jgi:hypothetical protein
MTKLPCASLHRRRADGESARRPDCRRAGRSASWRRRMPIRRGKGRRDLSRRWGGAAFTDHRALLDADAASTPSTSARRRRNHAAIGLDCRGRLAWRMYVEKPLDLDLRIRAPRWSRHCRRRAASLGDDRLSVALQRRLPPRRRPDRRQIRLRWSTLRWYWTRPPIRWMWDRARGRRPGRRPEHPPPRRGPRAGGRGDDDLRRVQRPSGQL